MKVCRKCGQAKELSEFHRARDMRDGHRNECKACWKAICRARYVANRDEYIERARNWQKAHPEYYQERLRRNREEDREHRAEVSRRGHLRRKYGLSTEDFEFLRVAQNDVCGICGEPEAAGLHIDHHHESGLIRGLLCGKCNKAIGLLKEDPALFDAASSYLQRTQLPLGCGDKTRPPTRVRRRTEEPAEPEAT